MVLIGWDLAFFSFFSTSEKRFISSSDRDRRCGKIVVARNRNSLIERDKVMRGVASAELSVTIYRRVSVVYVGRFSAVDSPLSHEFLIT